MTNELKGIKEEISAGERGGRLQIAETTWLCSSGLPLALCAYNRNSSILALVRFKARTKKHYF